MIKFAVLFGTFIVICSLSSAFAAPSGELSGQYSLMSGGPLAPQLKITFTGETAKNIFNQLRLATESHQAGGPWGVTVRESKNIRCVGSGEAALTQFKCSLAIQEDGTVLR